jgi:hypothetical protein
VLFWNTYSAVDPEPATVAATVPWSMEGAIA